MALTLEEALLETSGDINAAMDLLIQSLNDSITATEEAISSFDELQTAIDEGNTEQIDSLTTNIVESNETVVQSSNEMISATASLSETTNSIGGDTLDMYNGLLSVQTALENATASLNTYMNQLLDEAIEAIDNTSLTTEQLIAIHESAVSATTALNKNEYDKYVNSINILKAEQTLRQIDSYTRDQYLKQFRTISIPITLLAEADTTIFGEQLSISYDYYLEDVSALYISAQMVNNCFKYRDQNQGTALFQLDTRSLRLLATAFEFEIGLNTFDLDVVNGPSTYSNAIIGPDPTSFGNHYVQYLASLLFSHPQSQAPIKNDDYIKYQIHVLSGLGNQLYNQFAADVNNSTYTSNGIVQTMYEQLLLDKGRVPPYDKTNPSFKVFDFKPGDVLSFTINVSANVIYEAQKFSQNYVEISPDETFDYLNSSDYETGGKVKSKTWRVGFRLK